MIEAARKREVRTFLASVAIAAALVIPVVLVLQKVNDDAVRSSGQPAAATVKAQAPAIEPIVIVKWSLGVEPTWYVGPLSSQRERMIFCLRNPRYCSIEMRGP